jgi:uncharacterized protein YjdB
MKKNTNPFFKFLSVVARAMISVMALLWATSVYAQDPAQYGTPFSGVPDPRDVNMYQVHIRPYSAAGNLAGVTARLDAIKALGINVIYVMPIYPHGTDSRSSASPYSIKDFKAVASEYGTLADFRALVDGAHSRGMAVMLDFAVNGTSWDHPWITQHPDWYNQSGGVIQQLASFPDVAGLNFGNTAMRAALVDAMRYWIFAANIDGYRCDFANNPPLDFWTNTINNLRGITTHKILMLAEGDRLENFQTGFDFNFGDKWYYDAIKSIANGTSVAQIQTTTNTEYTYASATQQEVRYTANHDTETNETAIGVFKSHAGVIANVLVSGYMRGVPFITSGQEVDFNQTIPWPYTSVKINWGANTTAAADFTKILSYRNNSVAIRRGTMANYSDANVCAFTKTSGTEKVVVMTNLRNGTSNYVIPATLAGTYKDAYSGASVTLTSGATQSLAAYQYIVLTNLNVAPVSVTGVSVSPTSASIAVGRTQQLTATITPSNATNQTVTWTSSNNGVATVSSTGLVTGVAAGTATITVTTQDGAKTAISAITVTPASTFTVHFFRPSTWGTAIKIYWWAAQPAGTLADGTWPGVAMTNEGSATWFSYTFTNVTSTNLIFNDGTNQTADLNRAGTNGWYYNGAWYNSQPTTVPVTGVTVSPTSATVSTTLQLTATVAPSNATNQTVSWTSSNTGVATVSGTGLVTAVSSGTSTITVTTQDGNKTATCAVTVPATGGTYYAIMNRWKGTYLYDAGANVGYGATIANNNYKWQKVAVDATYFYLKNLGTGEYMHIENQTGSVQCAAGNTAWWSQQWSQDYIDGTWVRFRNRWQTGSIIHVEGQTGSAQYSGAQDGWYSAQWQLVPTAGRLATETDTDFSPASVEIYPNPSSGKQFNIAITGLAKNESANVTLHDVNGKIAFETVVHESIKVDHNLPTGLYFVRVRAKGMNVVKKLAVE